MISSREASPVYPGETPVLVYRFDGAGWLHKLIRFHIISCNELTDRYQHIYIHISYVYIYMWLYIWLYIYICHSLVSWWILVICLLQYPCNEIRHPRPSMTEPRLTGERSKLRHHLDTLQAANMGIYHDILWYINDILPTTVWDITKINIKC